MRACARKTAPPQHAADHRVEIAVRDEHGFAAGFFGALKQDFGGGGGSCRVRSNRPNSNFFDW